MKPFRAKTSLLRRFCVPMLCLPIVLMGAAASVRADTFTVTVTDDDGPGSLRQAIVSANAHPGADTIAFNILGGGVQTISPLSPLPDITDAVTVDGATQPGFADRPLIEIEGSAADTSNISGLTIRADKCVLRSLTLNRFGGAGIAVRNAQNVRVTNCLLGLDASGSNPLGCGYGLFLDGAVHATISTCVFSACGYGLYLNSGATGNQVEACQIGTDMFGASAIGNYYGVLCCGSQNTFDSNLISGNLLSGVTIDSGGSGNQITNNVIGLDDFYAPLPNGADGVDIFSGSANVLSGNTIAANVADGLLLSGPNVKNNVVTNNTILDSQIGVAIQAGASGSQVGGASSAGNTVSGSTIAGILIVDGGSAGNAISGNQIYSNGIYGVSISASGNSVTSNAIYGNGLNGVWIGSSDGATFAAAVPIRYNAIYGNGDLGIWLDGAGTLGGNRLSPAPNLLAAFSNGVAAEAHGTLQGLPNTAYEIEFFADFTPNPSGFGDGQIYLSSLTLTTDGFGSASINASLDATSPFVQTSLFLAATATDASGNTSQFSDAVPINVSNVIPTPYTLSPSAVLVGSPGFTLIVNGNGFVPGVTARWNGQDRPTTYISSAKISAVISAADVSSAGTFRVTVVNPPPGGGESAALIFTVANPVPAISSLTPGSALFGGSAFSLTINGANFVPASVAQWNGSNRATTFVSATQIIAAIAAADIAAAGTAQITAATPGPGGGQSNAQTFSITNPLPTAASLSPNTAVAGSAPLTVTVTGGNFVAATVIRWNGQSRLTTLISATQIAATLSASDLAVAGVNSVTAFTPGPGGGESAPLPFTVANPLPTLAALSQTDANAGSSPLIITLTGTGLVPTSTARWNGSDRVTTYLSTTTLTMALTRSDLAAPGSFPITVFNPGPGGGETAPRTFTTHGIPLLVITSLSAARASGTGQVVVTLSLKNNGTADLLNASITAAKLGGLSSVAPALPFPIGSIAVGATLNGVNLTFPALVASGNQLLILTIVSGGRSLTLSASVTIPVAPVRKTGSSKYANP